MASETLPAANYSVRNVISKGLGGVKLRVVTLTLTTDYGTPGWIITAANCKLRKILAITPGVVGVHTLSPTLSGTGAILQAIVGAAGINAEAADGLNSLDGLVSVHIVLGY